MKVSQYRLSPNEVEHLLKGEKEKRRKLRIVQVREQEKAHAAKLRVAVKAEKGRQIKLLEQEAQTELEAEKDEKLKQLEAEYVRCLKNIGEAHRLAGTLEKDHKDVKKRLEQEDNDKKAAKRHLVALKKEKTMQLSRKYEETKTIIARQSALEKERDRAAKIASLPAPQPDPVDLLELPKHKPVTVVDAFSSTYFHLSEEDYGVVKATPEKQLDARLLAKEEEGRYEDIQQDKGRTNLDYHEKANLRGKHALSKELLKQDYGQLLLDLSDLQRKDRDRRLKNVHNIPRNVFQPPHCHLEDKVGRQHRMEMKFEDMYSEETAVVMNATELNPCQSETSDDETTPRDFPPTALQDLTSKLRDPNRRESNDLKNLLNKVKLQRDHWIQQTSQDLPEHEVRLDLDDPQSVISVKPDEQSADRTSEQICEVNHLEEDQLTTVEDSEKYVGANELSESEDITMESRSTESSVNDVLFHPLEEAAKIRQAAQRQIRLVDTKLKSLNEEDQVENSQKSFINLQHKLEQQALDIQHKIQQLEAKRRVMDEKESLIKTLSTDTSTSMIPLEATLNETASVSSYRSHHADERLSKLRQFQNELLSKHKREQSVLNSGSRHSSTRLSSRTTSPYSSSSSYASPASPSLPLHSPEAEPYSKTNVIQAMTQMASLANRLYRHSPKGRSVLDYKTATNKVPVVKYPYMESDIFIEPEKQHSPPETYAITKEKTLPGLANLLPSSVTAITDDIDTEKESSALPAAIWDSENLDASISSQRNTTLESASTVQTQTSLADSKRIPVFTENLEPPSHSSTTGVLHDDIYSQQSQKGDSSVFYDGENIQSRREELEKQLSEIETQKKEIKNRHLDWSSKLQEWLKPLQSGSSSTDIIITDRLSTSGEQSLEIDVNMLEEIDKLYDNSSSPDSDDVQKRIPPVSKKVMFRDDITPHELSTIQEVETPKSDVSSLRSYQSMASDDTRRAIAFMRSYEKIDKSTTQSGSANESLIPRSEKSESLMLKSPSISSDRSVSPSKSIELSQHPIIPSPQDDSMAHSYKSELKYSSNSQSGSATEMSQYSISSTEKVRPVIQIAAPVVHYSDDDFEQQPSQNLISPFAALDIDSVENVDSHRSGTSSKQSNFAPIPFDLSMASSSSSRTIDMSQHLFASPANDVSKYRQGRMSDSTLPSPLIDLSAIPSFSPPMHQDTTTFGTFSDSSKDHVSLSMHQYLHPSTKTTDKSLLRSKLPLESSKLSVHQTSMHPLTPSSELSSYGVGSIHTSLPLQELASSSRTYSQSNSSTPSTVQFHALQPSKTSFSEANEITEKFSNKIPVQKDRKTERLISPRFSLSRDSSNSAFEDTASMTQHSLEKPPDSYPLHSNLKWSDVLINDQIQTPADTSTSAAESSRSFALHKSPAFSIDRVVKDVSLTSSSPLSLSTSTATCFSDTSHLSADASLRTLSPSIISTLLESSKWKVNLSQYKIRASDQSDSSNNLDERKNSAVGHLDTTNNLSQYAIDSTENITQQSYDSEGQLSHFSGDSTTNVTQHAFDSTARKSVNDSSDITKDVTQYDNFASSSSNTDQSLHADELSHILKAGSFGQRYESALSSSSNMKIEPIMFGETEKNSDAASISSVASESGTDETSKSDGSHNPVDKKSSIILESGQTILQGSEYTLSSSGGTSSLATDKITQYPLLDPTMSSGGSVSSLNTEKVSQYPLDSSGVTSSVNTEKVTQFPLDTSGVASTINTERVTQFPLDSSTSVTSLYSDKRESGAESINSLPSDQTSQYPLQQMIEPNEFGNQYYSHSEFEDGATHLGSQYSLKKETSSSHRMIQYPLEDFNAPLTSNKTDVTSFSFLPMDSSDIGNVQMMHSMSNLGSTIHHATSSTDTSIPPQLNTETSTSMWFSSSKSGTSGLDEVDGPIDQIKLPEADENLGATGFDTAISQYTLDDTIVTRMEDNAAKWLAIDEDTGILEEPDMTFSSLLSSSTIQDLSSLHESDLVNIPNYEPSQSLMSFEQHEMSTQATLSQLELPAVWSSEASEASVALETSTDRRIDKEMVNRNKRLYSQLEEVKQKRIQQERQKQSAENRQKAKDFQKKIQESLMKKKSQKK